MCGIAGILSLRGARPDLHRLTAMTAVQRHRGPDGEGHLCRGPVALGHRRLSIIDIARGAQPMSSVSGRTTVCYNGEIYNFPTLRSQLGRRGYRFRTRSDTEVILALYELEGQAGLARLEGMYAFALWDEPAQTLYLARDHAGIKPLYLAEDGDFLYFASEIKGVIAGLARRPDLDPVAVNCFFARQYIRGPETIYRGIEKLPTATIRSIDVRHNTRRDWTFWRPPTPMPGAEAGLSTLDQASQQLEEIVARAVSDHLLSDVPVGVFLSGGIDSSTILAFASKASTGQLSTFSVGFGDSRVDEIEYARQVARRYGSDHHELRVSADDGLRVLPQLVDSLDQPLADYAIVPTFLMSRFARDRVKVVLGGEGADEVFGGYWGRYVPYAGIDRIPLLARHLPLPTTRPALFLDTARRALLGERFIAAAELPAERALKGDLRRFRHAGAVNSALIADLRGWLVDDLLAKVDEMGMLASLEARVPFLDRRLIDFAGRMPGHFKVGITRHATKRVLRRMAQHHVPGQITGRKKHGFTVPVSSWLQSDLRNRFEELLYDSQVSRAWICPHYVRTLWQQHRGQKRLGLKLWSVLIFVWWLERHRHVDMPRVDRSSAQLAPDHPGMGAHR
ncbi:MAG: asparagine synthase (glutamine-hydrolyzing) [Proteobacteria bacterium]|nr:asparagine synthase (glutamine-hydrolyzing) [Pseudomonadota bacterium]